MRLLTLRSISPTSHFCVFESDDHEARFKRNLRGCCRSGRRVMGRKYRVSINDLKAAQPNLSFFGHTSAAQAVEQVGVRGEHGPGIHLRDAAPGARGRKEVVQLSMRDIILAATAHGGHQRRVGDLLQWAKVRREFRRRRARPRSVPRIPFALRSKRTDSHVRFERSWALAGRRRRCGAPSRSPVEVRLLNRRSRLYGRS